MAEKTPDKVENADKTEKTPAESPPKENPLTKEQMSSLQTIITDTICLMCRGVSAKYETMKIESLTVVTVDEQMVKVHFTKHMSADGKVSSMSDMGVSIWPIRKAGSWVYMAGSWREATPYCIVILTILEKTKYWCSNNVFFVCMN